MARAVRSVVRLAVAFCLLLTLSTPPAKSSPTPAIQGEMPSAGIYPEVRLRKLHLVRPDLIPYPIAYEVCC